MTPEEKAALEWLDRAILAQNCGRPWRFPLEDLRTLKSMLARPVLPEELDDDACRVLFDAWPIEYSGVGQARHAYRALRAHLTKPATKEVEVELWAVYQKDGCHWGTYSGQADAEVMAEYRKGYVVRLTGKTTVPA
jgi:hypothetical protein